jgi:peroxiredoxin
MREILTTVATVIIGIVHATTQRIDSTVQLREGDIAPDFTLPASDGRTYRLGDFAGRTVVIAWFPKAFTGG